MFYHLDQLKRLILSKIPQTIEMLGVNRPHFVSRTIHTLIVKCWSLPQHFWHTGHLSYDKTCFMAGKDVSIFYAFITARQLTDITTWCF